MKIRPRRKRAGGFLFLWQNSKMSILHRLPYEWQIGLRYTRAGKRASRNRFLSFISLISVAGIALGVAALVVVLSVMNGFEKEVTARMLSVLAHVEVMAADGAMPEWRALEAQALRNPEVRAAAPFAEVQGMVLREDTMKPVVIRGVLPEAEYAVSDIAKQTTARNLAALKPGSSNVVLGSELARSLDVKTGDKVRLLVAAPGAADSRARSRCASACSRWPTSSTPATTSSIRPWPSSTSRMPNPCRA
jgi:lipoprotein-releasing system permease protein